MKTLQLTLLASALIFAACKTSKKNTTTTAATTETKTESTTATPMGPLIFKSPDGINAPGNNELVAIQAKYKDATLGQLEEGYTIYKQGVCAGCHAPKNIYKRATEHWKDIIDDMAKRSGLDDEKKDAVYKYVLAVKATQPK